MGVPETPQPGLAGEQSQLPHFLCRGFWAWKASAQWVGLGVSRRSWDLGKGAAWEVFMWMDLLSWPLPSALSGLAPGSPVGKGALGLCSSQFSPSPLGSSGEMIQEERGLKCVGGVLCTREVQRGFLRMVFVFPGDLLGDPDALGC